MDKEVVVHIYNEILVIRKTEFESVVVRWMYLKPVIQSEVSQKEKNKFCMLTHIYEIHKNGSEEFIYRAIVEKQI